MPRTYSRSEWGARASRGGPGPLFGSNVQSIALHWPAITKPVHGVENVKTALRGWQNFHMDGRGWSDIAYQEAVDQEGNRYVLRGLDTQSGANGDDSANKANGAILLILAPGEQPSPAMIAAVREVVADHRRLFRSSRGVKGHSEVRPEPTSCPGPIVLGLIHEGAFEPVRLKPSVRRTLRKVTAAIEQAKADGYRGLADRLKKVREDARDKHSL